MVPANRDRLPDFTEPGRSGAADLNLSGNGLERIFCRKLQRDAGDVPEHQSGALKDGLQIRPGYIRDAIDRASTSSAINRRADDHSFDHVLSEEVSACLGMACAGQVVYLTHHQNLCEIARTVVHGVTATNSDSDPGAAGGQKIAPFATAVEVGPESQKRRLRSNEQPPSVHAL
ncbi:MULTISPECIES: hypothetical protein [unclassified Mesorhizobium]|uniref:hypothetical protein n=2 Tax=Mesorhizobium TaxID=68287 RepID=UPI0013DEB572|nr:MULTISPECIES: hypothetical protein [unclassified Mesorhizobium]